MLLEYCLDPLIKVWVYSDESVNVRGDVVQDEAGNGCLIKGGNVTLIVTSSDDTQVRW